MQRRAMNYMTNNFLLIRNLIWQRKMKQQFLSAEKKSAKSEFHIQQEMFKNEYEMKTFSEKRK